MSKSAMLGETFEQGQMLGGATIQFGGAIATYALGRLTGTPPRRTLAANSCGRN
jgi:hypothetical protein